MSAVKRRLFTLLSALSMLLAVMTCAVWVRSWQWVAAESGGSIVVCYCGGSNGADFMRKSDGTPERPQDIVRYLHVAPSPWRPAFKKGNWTGLPQTSSSYTFPYWWISMPEWILTLAFCVLPALWVLQRLRGSRRMSARQCLVCGYDLRATPGRCPECGTEPQATVQSPHA
jgi:hypothetical protein